MAGVASTRANKARAPMSAGETRQLIQQTASIILGSMNELETRIVALERELRLAERRSESGLILPESVQ